MECLCVHFARAGEGSMACDPANEACDWFDSDGLGLNGGNTDVTGLFVDPAHYNDPWHWLPMTRWRDLNDFFYTNEGGVSGFFLAAINSGIQTMVALLFSLASFMWTLTVWFVRVMVGAPTLAAQFLSQMDVLFFKYARAVFSSGIGIAAVALSLMAAVWMIAKGGRGREAVRRVMASVLPLALILALVGFSSDSTYVAAVAPDGRVVWVPEGDGLPPGYSRPPASVRHQPQVHSVSGPEWLFSSTLNMASLMSDPVLSFVDAVRSDTSNAPDQISTCDSYVAVLEGNFIRAWNTQEGPHFEQATGSTSGAVALRNWATTSNRLRMRLAVLISRIWERSYAAGYGQAQFGDGAAAERAFCIIADWRSKDVTPVEMVAVWRETCNLASIPSLPLAEFMPLAGCGLMSEIEEYDTSEAQREARWRECLERPTTTRGNQGVNAQMTRWFQGHGSAPPSINTEFNDILSVQMAPQTGWDTDDAIEFMSESRQAWAEAAPGSIAAALGERTDRLSFVAGWICYSSPPGSNASEWVADRVPGIFNRWLYHVRTDGVTVLDWLSQTDRSEIDAEIAKYPQSTNSFFGYLWSEANDAMRSPQDPPQADNNTQCTRCPAGHSPGMGDSVPLWRYSDAGGYATAIFSPTNSRNLEGDRFQMRTFHGTWAMCDFANWAPQGNGIYATPGTGEAMTPDQMSAHTSARMPFYSSAGMITDHGTKLASWIPVPGGNGIVKVDPRGLGLGGTRSGAKENERISAQACFAYLFGDNSINNRDKEDHQAGQTLTLGQGTANPIGADLSSGDATDGLWLDSTGQHQYPNTRGFTSDDPSYPGSANDYALHRLGRTPEQYSSSASYVSYEIAPNSSHPDAATGFVQTDASAKGAAGIFEAIHGRGAAANLILAIMAVIVAWAYLWTLSGLALGSALSIVILALLIATLPLTLLISALPFEAARSLPRRLLKLGVGAALSYTVFTVVITMILVVIDVLMDIVRAASVDSSELLYSVILGGVPLIAIKAVGAVSKQFGIDITKMKGAFQLTSGMAFAAMKPPGKDGRHYIDRGTRIAGAAAGGVLGGAALGMGSDLRRQPALGQMAKDKPHSSAKNKAAADAARATANTAALPSASSNKKPPTATTPKHSTSQRPDSQTDKRKPTPAPAPDSDSQTTGPQIDRQAADNSAVPPFTASDSPQSGTDVEPTTPTAPAGEADQDPLAGKPDLNEDASQHPSLALPTPDKRGRIKALADFARSHPALSASGAVLATAGIGPAVATYGLAKLAATSMVNIPRRLGRRLGLPIPTRRNPRWGDVRLAGRTAKRVAGTVRGNIAQLRPTGQPPFMPSATDQVDADITTAIPSPYYDNHPDSATAHTTSPPIEVQEPPSRTTVTHHAGPSSREQVAPVPYPRPQNVMPGTAQAQVFVSEEKLAERLDRINETLDNLRREQDGHNVTIATHLMPLERRLADLRSNYRDAATAQQSAAQSPRRRYNRIDIDKHI